MTSTHTPDPTANLRAWVAALRSGAYSQAQCGLRDWTRHRDGMVFSSYDALGVACDLYGPDGWVGHPDPFNERHLRVRHGHYLYHGRSGYLPPAVIFWLGLHSDDPLVDRGDGVLKPITALNDGWPKPYGLEDIADCIERTFITRKEALPDAA